MSKTNSVKLLLAEVIADLEKEGQDSYAEDLNKYLLQLEDQSSALHALERINGLCNMKALGDAYMSNFQGYEWPNKIEKLSQKCVRAIREHARDT